MWPTGPLSNLTGFAAGNANTGYFGLPVAMQLFGPDVVGVAVFFFVGFILYENSVGFYVAARGKNSARESIRRLLKIPTIYAFTIGVFLNFVGVQLPEVFHGLAINFRGAYSVLGMMLIGVGVSQIEKLQIDWKFLITTHVAKFLAWPIVIGTIVFVDSLFFHLYSQQTHQIMILMASTPMAANTVAFATELKIEPDKAALAVLVSTIVALFFIPFMTVNFMQ